MLSPPAAPGCCHEADALRPLCRIPQGSQAAPVAEAVALIAQLRLLLDRADPQTAQAVPEARVLPASPQQQAEGEAMSDYTPNCTACRMIRGELVLCRDCRPKPARVFLKRTPIKRRTPIARSKKPIRNRGKQPHTVADRKRFQTMQGLLCVACAQLDVLPAYPEGCDVSHLKSGNSRIGHDATLLECPWHHRGVPPTGHTQESARQIWGPSRALTPAAYVVWFGTDTKLLALTNAALERRRQRTVGQAP